MIIAIDGPAASGKGTLAKRIAAALGLAHLDTGLLYRGTAHAVLTGGGTLDDIDAAVSAARSLDPAQLDDAQLRGKSMGEAASRVAAFPQVRAALIALQRGFARRAGGAVLDGRDIGTVICPEADIKIFVVATAEARATRRHRELQGRGEVVDRAIVLADIIDRDRRDSTRAVAPLAPAHDAVVLDTTDLDIEAAFAAALAIVDARSSDRTPQTATAHRNAVAS